MGLASAVDELLVALGVGVADATVLLALGTLGGGWLVLLGWDVLRGLTDLLVNFEVGVLEVVSVNAGLDVGGELLLVLLWLLLLHALHVLGNVATENALTVGLGVVGRLIRIVTVELLLVVRDLKTAIEGTLHGRENLGAKSGALKAD